MSSFIKNRIWFWCLVSVLTACRPEVAGAPCETSLNCPETQTCVDKRCAVGSRNGGGEGGGAAGGGQGGGATGGGGGPSNDGGALTQFYELTSAGARLQGGSITMDVQVGHATPPTKMTGGTLELTGAAAVQR